MFTHFQSTKYIFYFCYCTLLLFFMSLHFLCSLKTCASFLYLMLNVIFLLLQVTTVSLVDRQQFQLRFNLGVRVRIAFVTRGQHAASTCASTLSKSEGDNKYFFVISNASVAKRHSARNKHTKPLFMYVYVIICFPTFPQANLTNLTN